MEVKCRSCGKWFQFEEYKQHACLNQSVNDFIPRYFFGPEIDSEGNIYHLESEDGVHWFRKYVKPADEFLQRKRTDEDFTEPVQGIYKGV